MLGDPGLSELNPGRLSRILPAEPVPPDRRFPVAASEPSNTPRARPCAPAFGIIGVIASRHSLNLLVFLATTLACAQVVSLLWEDDPDPHDNLPYLLKHPHAFDVVFAGSSLVGHMIDPRIFDETLREEGFTATSYNIGRGGSLAFETDYRLRRLMRRSPGRLRFVIIDCMEFRPDCDDTDAGRQRFVAWHDLGGTRAVLRALALSRRVSPREKVKFLRIHLGAALERYNPIGKAPALLGLAGDRADRSPGNGPADIESRFASSRGYESLVALRERGFAGHLADGLRRFRNGEDDYAEMLEARRQGFEAPGELSADDFETAAVLAQQESLRARGVVPVYLAAPAFLHDPAYPRALQLTGLLPHVLLLDDPGEYPELYAMDARQNRNHLNDEGSQAYSRTIARRFAEMLRADPDLAQLLPFVRP
jgi:hypothetical protein